MGDTVSNLKVRFSADTKNFEKDMESGKVAIKGFTDTGSSYVQQFASVFGISIGDLSDKLSNMKKQAEAMSAGIKGASAAANIFSGALKVLRLALIGTGIGALVVALGTLIAYFTKTQRGADQVRKVMASMKAIIDVLIDRASSFGEGLFKIFTGKFEEGWKTLKNSLKGAGTEIKNESSQAWELEDALQKLEQREIDLTTVQAERRQKIEELRLKARDLTLTEKERKNALGEAIAVEKQMTADETSLQKERVRILQEQTDMNESTREDYQKLADEKAKLSDIEAQSLSNIRSMSREYNTLTKQIEANAEALKKKRNAENESVSKEISPVSLTTNISTNLETNKLESFAEANRSAAEKAEDSWTEASQIINSSLNDLAVGFGEALGNIATGSNAFSEIGNLLGETMGNLAISLGKTSIAAGIGVEAIKTALKSLNGVAAIAAGVALVALGTAIKSSLSSIASGTYSSNSGTYDTTSGNYSESSSGTTNSESTINVNITGTLKASGSDLVAALEKESTVSRIRK